MASAYIFDTILELKRDLEAKIITRESEGHYELVEVLDPSGGGGGSDRGRIEEEKWIEDVSEESIPDEEKRRNARRQLEEIFASSKSYAVKYAAAAALGREYDLIKSWQPEIAKALNDENLWKVVSEDVAELVKRSYSKELKSFLEDIVVTTNNKDTAYRAGYVLGWSDYDIWRTRHPLLITLLVLIVILVPIAWWCISILGLIGWFQR